MSVLEGADGKLANHDHALSVPERADNPAFAVEEDLLG